MSGTALGDTVVELLAELGTRGDDMPRWPVVTLAWRRAAGPYLATHSRPVSLHESVLTVAVDSSHLVREVRRLGRQILDRLEDTLGCTISRLEVVAVPRMTRVAPATRRTVDRPRSEKEPDQAPAVPAWVDDVRPEIRPVVLRLLRKHAARNRSLRRAPDR